MMWEYKTIKIAAHGVFGGKVKEAELDARLNELGRQGWELVSAFSSNTMNGVTRDVVAVFKRRS